MHNVISENGIGLKSENILTNGVSKVYKRHAVSLDPVPGAKYGKLTILGEAERRGVQRYWLCLCDCGREHKAQADHIRRGLTVSCGGCKGTKGHSQSSEYRAWRDAIARCTKPLHRAWKHYGARGITVCEEWREDFQAFLAHIGPKPRPRLTLDRIDNDGNYEPGNVRWATRKQQANNTRKQKRLRQE